MKGQQVKIFLRSVHSSPHYRTDSNWSTDILSSRYTWHCTASNSYWSTDFWFYLLTFHVVSSRAPLGWSPVTARWKVETRNVVPESFIRPIRPKLQPIHPALKKLTHLVRICKNHVSRSEILSKKLSKIYIKKIQNYIIIMIFCIIFDKSGNFDEFRSRSISIACGHF